MKKYKVLWIDDQWEDMVFFKMRCEKNDMEIVPCRFAVEGMTLFENSLQSWSAIILDAKSLVKDDNETASLKALRHSVNRIHELAFKRSVPYFIFTGQPDLLSNEMFQESFGKFYEKAKDEERLIEDIKIAADKLTITQIRQKYSDVLSVWPNRENEIVGILRVLIEEDNDCSNCLNEIRKMLEDVMEQIAKSGLLLVEWNKTNLAECSKFLGNRWLQALIPVYIQRSIHSCVEISNPGSHRTDLEQAIKDGRAPYVLRSTIFELMNILLWCKNLPSSENRETTSLLVRGLKAKYEEEKSRKMSEDDKS